MGGRMQNTLFKGDWEQLWGEGECSSCQEWVSMLLGGIWNPQFKIMVGLCCQARMASVGLIPVNSNIFNSFSIVRNHSSLPFSVNVVFTLVHMYSDATPVITLTYHLYKLSGSHLQVPLDLTNHVCQRSHAINVPLWQVRQGVDTGMVSL